MKKLHLLKTILLLCALVVGSNCVWAAKITSYTNIVSGKSYYIGATTSSTDYYLSVDGSTVATGVAGTAVTDKASATIFVFEGSSASWAIKFKSSGNYMSLASSKANGKVDIVGSSTDWEVSNVSEKICLAINGYALEKNNSGTQFGSYASTQTDVWLEEADLPTHTASFSINGVIDDGNNEVVEEGGDITFPSPAIEGLALVGWTTAAIVGTQDTAPAILVTEATMGNADITYYAVFAKKTVTEDEFTKSYGFETESDSDWEITNFDRNSSYHNTGSYSGYTNKANSYVAFKHKVNVKEFSFAFTRTSGNNNYNVYIETSTDGSEWTAAETYAMSSFNSDGTFSTKTKTFDGTKAYYVRFHCYNTTAARYVDDVTIVYDGEEVSYSAYRTSIPTFAVSIGSAKYATFCDEVARDFSASGITVYAAAATASSVEFDEVTDGIVPANTGVVLFSETTKADVAIPVATSAASYDFSSNEMIGVNEKTMVAYAGEGSKKNFILANGTSGVGFYKAKDTGANLAAHKAYLSTATAASARDFLGFGDETTGMEKVEAAKQNAGVYFNLAGQRVVNPTKGLYIVNGKKVIK